MKTNSKGFSLIELMTVVLIIAVLLMLLLPNLKLYVQKAKFLENIQAASAMKTETELCIMKMGSLCVPGTTGAVPALVANYGGNVDKVEVSSDLSKITATSTSVFGPNSDAPYTFVLARTVNANGVTIYSVDPSSTCIVAGLC